MIFPLHQLLCPLVTTLQGAASVVTCVTNQAIDAVSEKLSITHEVGVFEGEAANCDWISPKQRD